MIEYDAGNWGLMFIFRLNGSVLLKALAFGLPAGIVAIALTWTRYDLYTDGAKEIWSGYNFILGFLIVFRNNQAYARFWEGASLIQQVRGEWLNAVSSLVAFCSHADDKHAQVAEFQHLLVRLMSMLHCAALQQIAEVKDDCFEIIVPKGIEKSRLKFLSRSGNQRCDVLVQWLQRIIVEAEAAGTLKIAPPILSRVFQELSRGIVNLHNVRRIKDVPFPFPYAQMITIMMLIHLIVTPILASQLCESAIWAGTLSLFAVTAFWSMHYIALEIEQPFGEDMNDLPVGDMQREMNDSLTLLLEHEVQVPPKFDFDVASDITARQTKSSSDMHIRMTTVKSFGPGSGSNDAVNINFTRRLLSPDELGELNSASQERACFAVCRGSQEELGKAVTPTLQERACFKDCRLSQEDLHTGLPPALGDLTFFQGSGCRDPPEVVKEAALRERHEGPVQASGLPSGHDREHPGPPGHDNEQPGLPSGPLPFASHAHFPSTTLPVDDEPPGDCLPQSAPVRPRLSAEWSPKFEMMSVSDSQASKPHLPEAFLDTSLPIRGSPRALEL